MDHNEPVDLNVSPTPRAPTHQRAKTVFHTSLHWRRLSISGQVERNTIVGNPKKLRSLQDLGTNELLDVIKNLGCPLKARKCLQTVGINGKDFERYTDRDLEMVGVNRKDIRQKVMLIQKKILDHGCKVPESLLDPRSKREIRASSQEDPFDGIIDLSAPGRNPGLRAAASYDKAVLKKGETYSAGFGGGKAQTVDDVGINKSPKTGTLTPKEKEEIVEDLKGTMEAVAVRLERMSAQNVNVNATALNDASNGGNGKADEVLLPEISPKNSTKNSKKQAN
mmetsp:Transcript_27612/g.55198  ORF Transcript_27612/g.55198 Transcript_27612/m.55198 type:complete len:280 (+) Transcript_27612:217-1056(+)